MDMTLDHVAVKVEDIQQSVDWYRLNLEAEILYQDETWGLLQIGNSKIALVTTSQHPPHIAFKVTCLEDFPCSPSDIKEHRDGSKYFYGLDPAGNTVEWIFYPDEL